MQISNKRVMLFGFVPLICACLAFLLQFVWFSLGEIIIQYTAFLSLIFSAFVLFQANDKRIAPYWVAIAFVLWFICTCIFNGDAALKDSLRDVYVYCIIYGMAFPFAFVMRDQKRLGLRICAILCIVFTTVIAGLGVFWMLARNTKYLHYSMESWFVLALLGKDYRLCLQPFMVPHHPNTTALLFFIGFLSCLYLIAEDRRKPWRVILLGLCALPLLAGISYTVSNSVMICCCLLLAYGAFWLLQGLRIPKKAWLKQAVAVVCALVVLLGAYKGFDLSINGTEAVHQWLVHRSYPEDDEQMDEVETSAALTDDAAAAAASAAGDTTAADAPTISDEVVPDEPTVLNRDIDIQRLTTLTDRTRIYTWALEYATKNPLIFLKGISDWDLYAAVRADVNKPHVHSSFLQVLMSTGIIGLLLILALIWFMLRAAFCIVVLCHKTSTVGDKILAAIPPLLLLVGVVENYLFVEFLYPATTIGSFLLFLCAGYLLVRAKELMDARKAAKCVPENQ